MTMRLTTRKPYMCTWRHSFDINPLAMQTHFLPQKHNEDHPRAAGILLLHLQVLVEHRNRIPAAKAHKLIIIIMDDITLQKGIEFAFT